MPSQSDIARHFGVSRERVNQLVKEGMPTNSIRAAEKWRESRGNKRRPTNKKNSSATLQAKPGRPRKPKVVPKTGDSLLDALTAAIAVHERAYEMVEDAMAKGNDEQMSIRLSVHNKATEARFAAEKLYREEMERRGQLILLTMAIDEFRKGFDFVLTRLRRMPSGLAPQCNPQNPLMAFTLMERECNAIIAEAQRQYTPDAIPIPPQPKPTYAEPTTPTQAPA